MQIPLCKLYSRNVPNTAIFKVTRKSTWFCVLKAYTQIVERNSRKSDFVKSDLRALVVATRVAAKRIIEICDRFGVEAYEQALDILLARNKLAIGKIIRETISSERVFFEDYIDDDGFGVGPWRIAWRVFFSIVTNKADLGSSTMWKESSDDGDEVVVLDFDGTDPQSDRSINFALSHEMLKMFIAFYLLTVFVSAWS